MESNMNVKSAIETGNVDLLRRLLTDDPARANELIVWGKNLEIRTHPLHYVSDMLFGGSLQSGNESPLIEALLKAGADPNHQAPNGETPLIGAASLHAEDVGLHLLEAGAQPNSRGVFHETALHWAAHTGLRRLVERLLTKGADVNSRDDRYNSTPQGWAIHGRFSSHPGRQPDRHGVAALLVAAGAIVESECLTDEDVRSDPRLLAILSGHGL